jgi:hypothetical protein
MSAKIGITAVAFALVAAGCASVPRSGTGACNTHVCPVAVTVTGCTISADPPDLEILSHRVEIHWDIVSPGYTFPEDGIVIRDDQKNEFTDPRRAEQNRKFIWNDKNSFEKTYKYSIKVMNGAAACAPLDPGIINRG